MIDVSWKKNAGEGGEGMSSNEGQKAEAKQSFSSVRLDTIARQLGPLPVQSTPIRCLGSFIHVVSHATPHLSLLSPRYFARYPSI